MITIGIDAHKKTHTTVTRSNREVWQASGRRYQVRRVWQLHREQVLIAKGTVTVR